jgi:hypothetical protein
MEKKIPLNNENSMFAARIYLDSSSSYPILFSPSNNPGNIHCANFTKFGQQTLNFHY